MQLVGRVFYLPRAPLALRANYVMHELGRRIQRQPTALISAASRDVVPEPTPKEPPVVSEDRVVAGRPERELVMRAGRGEYRRRDLIVAAECQRGGDDGEDVVGDHR